MIETDHGLSNVRLSWTLFIPFVVVVHTLRNGCSKVSFSCLYSSFQ